MARESRNIRIALAQGRHQEREDVEPIEEVGPERPALHRLGQIAVRARHETDVDIQLLVSADTPKGAGVEDTKELLVPEELALDEGRRDRAAVDRDERPPNAARERVYGTGRDLLARAALPGDHHGCFGARHAGDQAEDFLHRRRLADHLPEMTRGRRLGARRGVWRVMLRKARES